MFWKPGSEREVGRTSGDPKIKSESENNNSESITSPELKLSKGIMAMKVVYLGWNLFFMHILWAYVFSSL